MDLPAAIFEPDGTTADGERFLPTELARGPWSPHAQHGGAPAALLARAIERCEPRDDVLVARMTIELLRPVPLTPLEVVTRVVRPGKKVQLVEATIADGDTVVVRAVGLRLRTDELALPVPERVELDFPSPEDGEPFEIRFTDSRQPPEIGFWRAVELSVGRGTWGAEGPAAMWFRLVVPVVAGEEIAPLQRVAAAADFGNGISAALERGRYSFINPDLTIYLHRLPVGEWVALDARTHAEANGVGVAESALHDEGGRIGRSLQAILIDHM